MMLDRKIIWSLVAIDVEFYHRSALSTSTDHTHDEDEGRTIEGLAHMFRSQLRAKHAILGQHGIYILPICQLPSSPSSCIFTHQFSGAKIRNHTSQSLEINSHTATLHSVHTRCSAEELVDPLSWAAQSKLLHIDSHLTAAI